MPYLQYFIIIGPYILIDSLFFKKDNYQHEAWCPNSTVQIPETNFVDSTEDCLVLNIFRPENRDESLPIMIWIHGGELPKLLGNPKT